MSSGTILVTGAAGFIGMHTVLRMAAGGYNVVGLDNLNDYYDVSLKIDRLKNQGITLGTDSLKSDSQVPNIRFVKGDITDSNLVDRLFEEFDFTEVVHLAAQAGVRYSMQNPALYISTNVNGFFNILEASRKHGVRKVLFASSSSVYGTNKRVPFTEDQPINSPVSLYAATKASNELIAHAYSSSFDMKIIAMRFFTVYGPWDRPDMALHRFTQNILTGKPIEVYNCGRHLRDFTYIEDLVDAIQQLFELPPDGAESYQVVNVGANSPTSVNNLIQTIEAHAGRIALRIDLPLQPGDMENTYAGTNKLLKLTGNQPQTKLDVGVKRYLQWFKEYYGYQHR